MYENFAFPERDKAVTGYHFSCENPSHVLCLIHGIGEHAGRYKRMARILAEKGCLWIYEVMVFQVVCVVILRREEKYLPMWMR